MPAGWVRLICTKFDKMSENVKLTLCDVDMTLGVYLVITTDNKKYLLCKKIAYVIIWFYFPASKYLSTHQIKYKTMISHGNTNNVSQNIWRHTYKYYHLMTPQGIFTSEVWK